MPVTRRRLVAIVASAIAVGAVLLLRRPDTTRCDEPSRFPNREASSPDGLRHYVPDTCQIDANGYRNTHVPAHADIVTLGDSNTWGASVYADETWPRVLERETGLSTYNIAMPGWGPVDFQIGRAHV